MVTFGLIVMMELNILTSMMVVAISGLS
jgi:hypothetical protein